jgi:hypothetical protein
MNLSRVSQLYRGHTTLWGEICESVTYQPVIHRAYYVVVRNIWICRLSAKNIQGILHCVEKYVTLSRICQEYQGILFCGKKESSFDWL